MRQPTTLRIVILVLVLLASLTTASRLSLRQRYASSSPIGTAVKTASAKKGGACPCNDTFLCQPIQKQGTHKEVFAFQVNPVAWSTFDWDKITTVASYNREIVAEFPEEYCFAKSKGVRFVLATGPPLEILPNATARHLWVKETMAVVKENFLDGVNVDFEASINNQTLKDGLTLLMVELADHLRPAIAGGGQLSFDVSGMPPPPHSTWGRQYDYKALAVICDFLILMDYDAWDYNRPADPPAHPTPYCAAGPNAMLYTTTAGIEGYLEIYDDPSKYVLAVPWYGHNYGCMNPFNGTDTICELNCTVAGSTEVDYDTLMDVVYNPKQALAYRVNTTDTGAGSWAYVSFKDPGLRNPVSQAGWFQAWFDTPATLALKYKFAAQMGIRGVSMWHVDSVSATTNSSSRQAKERREMWAAMDYFLNGTNTSSRPPP